MNNKIKLKLISMPGTEDFCSKVEYYLKTWNNINDSMIVKTSLPRFNTGDAKAILDESIRGDDLFIISDPYNYSIRYNMRGILNYMSPDDHYQDIKRIVSAINGKAHRVNLMFNLLYSSRQHSRNMRESLDCAMSLMELGNLQIKNIITFDAHDPKVQNASPLISFDNLYPNYQMLKTLMKNVSDILFTPEKAIIIAPDAGGVQRCLKLAESLSLDIGMFYKQRDVLNVKNGNNPLKRHEFIGGSIEGKDVIIVDDILATGESLIDSFYELKKIGAKRIFAFITFGMFTKGYSLFDEAYKKGVFDKLLITNLTYRPLSINENKPYVLSVDMSKYAAYVINCIHREESISNVIDPNIKIKELLYKNKM